MLDLTLAALAGLLVGAGLTYTVCRILTTEDAADLARLRRDYANLYRRMHEREAELFVLLSHNHQQLIAVDRCVEDDR